MEVLKMYLGSKNIYNPALYENSIEEVIKINIEERFPFAQYVPVNEENKLDYIDLCYLDKGLKGKFFAVTDDENYPFVILDKNLKLLYPSSYVKDIKLKGIYYLSDKLVFKTLREEEGEVCIIKINPVKISTNKYLIDLTEETLQGKYLKKIVFSVGNIVSIENIIYYIYKIEFAKDLFEDSYQDKIIIYVEEFVF